MKLPVLSRFGRNVLSLVKANVLAQVIVLVSLPLLTRIYSPDEFGVLAVFSGIIALCSAFAALKVDWSIPIAHSEKSSLDLVIIGFCSSLFFALLVMFTGDSLLDFSASISPKVKPYGLFVPLLSAGILIACSRQIIEACHIRSRHLRYVGFGKIYQALVNITICLMLGLLGLGANGLIIGSIAGFAIALSILAYYGIDFFRALLPISPASILNTFNSHFQELLYSSMASTINRLGQSAFPLLLALNYDVRSVGMFALAQRLAVTPTVAFTNAISQSFWAEVARLIDEEPIKAYRIYIHTSRKLLLLMFAIIFLLVFFSITLDYILGKEEWRGAGRILLAITPMVAGQIAVSPLSHLIAHRKQKWQFLWDLLRLTLLVGVLVIAPVISIDFERTLFVVSLVSLFMYCLLFYLNILAYKVNAKKEVRSEGT